MENRTPFYRRNLLDDAGRERYDRVIEAIRTREKTLPDDLTDAWTAVADHPELFWATGTLEKVGDSDTWCIGYYSLSDDEIAREQAEIDRVAGMLLDLAPSDGTEWDKALYVYETLAQLVDYEEDEEGIATEHVASDGSWDHGRDWSRTIYGPLVHHRAVCTGYTKAAQRLLQRLGIECLHLSGARGTRHCWILARLDGAYSFMDVTWANATSKVKPGIRYVAHDYFGLTYADLAELPHHEIPTVVPLPSETADDHDWFKRTNRFAETFDPAWVDGAVERARTSHSGYFELKCASDDVRDRIESYLSEHHGVVCEQRRLGVLTAWLD